MISRRNIDEIFLWILPTVVIGNGISWSIYFHIHNLISALTPDQFYIATRSINFVFAWLLLEYCYDKIMWPYLCTSIAICGLAAIWLIWSWALANGFDNFD